MLRLALPVVGSELGWMSMGAVDTMMVGRLGPEAIGAVGIGNVVFFSVAIFGIGLLLGLDTLVSQAFGAGRIADCHRSLVQGGYLALAITAPTVGLTLMASSGLAWAGIDPGVTRAAAGYLEIMAWGVPPLLLYSAIRRYSQGMGRVAPIMAALVLANLANVLGNWVLIEGRLGAPALGVRGSGWATVIARVVMLAVVAGDAWRHGRRSRSGWTAVSLRPDGPRLGALLALGWPAAVHVTLEVAVFALAGLLAGRLGRDALAAHEVVLQVASMAFMVPLGVSSAGAVRVGQALGRGSLADARRAGWMALALGAGFMAASGLTMLAVPGPILGVFTRDLRVTAIAGSLLTAAAIFQVFDGLQVVGSGILRGAGQTRIPMYVNLLAHWGVGLPIAYLLSVTMRWGVLGVWVGLSAGLILAGVVQVAAWGWVVSRLVVGDRPLDG